MVKKRLYYGRLLASIGFFPEGSTGKESPRFILQLTYDYQLHGIYEGNTPDEIIEKVKADGYQVWGKEALDYTYPRNALDYILHKHYLITVYGITENEAEDILQMRRRAE